MYVCNVITSETFIEQKNRVSVPLNLLEFRDGFQANWKIHSDLCVVLFTKKHFFNGMSPIIFTNINSYFYIDKNVHTDNYVFYVILGINDTKIEYYCQLSDIIN